MEVLYTCHFVKFESIRYSKEEKLISDGNEESDCEIVAIKDMNLSHCDRTFFPVYKLKPRLQPRV